jgi:hypothetical protein
VKFIEQASAAPNDYQSLLVARNVHTGERKFFLSKYSSLFSTANPISYTPVRV